jgi:hypothetical protein
MAGPKAASRGVADSRCCTPSHYPDAPAPGGARRQAIASWPVSGSQPDPKRMRNRFPSPDCRLQKPRPPTYQGGSAGVRACSVRYFG